MFRRVLPRKVRLHRAFPVLVAAFVLPSDRRRERSPVFFSSLKSLAGFSLLFLPQVPIPDTSKIKDKLLSTLPSWTVESAVSKFVKRPEADIIVGISMQMPSLTAFVMYYPKGVEILAESRIHSGIEEYKVRMPVLRMVDDWDFDEGEGIHRNATISIMKYSSEFPHLPVGPGLKVNGSYKLWDPERADFRVHFTDFFPSQEVSLNRPKPPAFALTERQIMTDYARSIRQHIEEFISREIVDNAMIVNDAPVVKWMILYPDCMDSIETAPGVTVKRNFVSALKDAGFPINNSDIPPIRPDSLHQGSDERFNESVIEDLHTHSSKVEFFSAGFASLINIASPQTLGTTPLVPGLPQERPFIAVIDDEEYITARRCIFTPHSRFGVMQQQVCAVTRSPVFKQFPENMLDVVANILHDMHVFEELNEETIQMISNYAVKHWPESKNWSDVIDILESRMSKTPILLEATNDIAWGVDQEIDTPPRITPISSFEFAKVIRGDIYAPAIGVFGDIHGVSPEIKDAVLIDSGRGESDAYAIILRGIYTIKDAFLEDSEYSDPDDLFIEGFNITKLLDMELEAGTIKREELHEDEEEFVKQVSDTHDHLDRARYDRMKVTVAKPEIHQPFQIFGLADAAGMELSRIFLDAHRK
ncbi:hypothetical protein TWF730_007886 [Orbilia blumenaviensis]|uniref:Uncharacterized protein n=1 Tax=Orbilia blumenaviensis TaxID=1796055 RepID=A0AAV9VBW6_9PEZI